MQSIVDAEHAQTPAAQTWPPVHTRPHAPQLVLSLMRFTQVPAQSVCPVGHTQTPIAHDCPPEHARPHVPHDVLVAVRLVSQPLAGLLSQLPKPALHAPIAQVPEAQVADALANTHGRPHAPQWLASLAKFTSQPLAGLLSQLPKPALHAIETHAPPAHVGIPLVRLQTRPHMPQLRASVAVVDSQPLVVMPSQSASPVAQSVPTMHVPEAQKAVRPVGAAQRLAQRPHDDESVRRSVSQPLVALPSQSPKPVAHDRS